jgi:hypothetical protein
VRFLLELQGVDGARATYRATVLTPTADFSSTCVLDEAGAVDLPPTGSEADDMLQMLAKLTARGAAKRRDDGLPPWPQRVLRWRGPGRGE